MAGEIVTQITMAVRKNNINNVLNDGPMIIDMDGYGGPAPGQVTVPTTGVDIDLSELDIPGECLIKNLDTTNFVIGGVTDGTDFIPLFEIEAGKKCYFRFYRYFGQDWTGTGTSGGTTWSLRLQADTAECKVVINAYEA